MRETNDIINRMKLLMGYDSKKTLTENVKTILVEDATNVVDLKSVKQTQNITDEQSEVYNPETGEIKTPKGWMYAGYNIEILGSITSENIGRLKWMDSNGVLGEFNNVPIEIKTELIQPPVVSHYTNSAGDTISLFAQQSSKQKIDKNDKFSGFTMIYYTTSAGGGKSTEYNPISQKDADEHLRNGEVWDPECMTDSKEYRGNGSVATVKKKTGCWAELPPTNGLIDKNGKRLIGLRKDKFGNYVPYGFDVDYYNEYLTKKSGLAQGLKECLKGVKDKMDSDGKYYLDNHPTDYLGKGGEYNRTELYPKLNADCQSSYEKALKELESAYYHEDFPYGMPPEDYKEFIEVKQRNESEKDNQIKQFEESHKYCYEKEQTDYGDGMGRGKPMKYGGYYYFGVECLSAQDRKAYVELKDKYQSVEEFMFNSLQYDPHSIQELSKSDLDKWWEKWRWIGELVIWAVIDYASAGVAAELTAARQGYVISKLLPKIFKSVSTILPAGIGIYDMVKEGKFTEESAMWFMIALLPFAHSSFKFEKPPTSSDCRSLIHALTIIPPNSPENITKLMSVLTKEQKQIFRKISRMSSDELKIAFNDGLKIAEETLTKAERQELLTIVKSSAGKAKGMLSLNTEIWYQGLKSAINNLTLTFARDISGMEIVSRIFKKFGITSPALQEEIRKIFDEHKSSTKDQMILANEVYKILEENPKIDQKKFLERLRNKAFENPEFVSSLTNLTNAGIIKGQDFKNPDTGKTFTEEEMNSEEWKGFLDELNKE